MVLLLTAQLIILFYRYLPMAKKDYAPPERRRAILGLGSYSAVYLLALIELAGRCGLLPLTTSCLFPWSFAVMAFFGALPDKITPTTEKVRSAGRFGYWGVCLWPWPCCAGWRKGPDPDFSPSLP